MNALEVPENVERATTAYSSLGPLSPAVGGVTAAASLALCQAFGTWDLSAVGASELALGAGVGVAVAARRVIRARDHLHDRMEQSTPIPAGTPVEDATRTGGALVAWAGWWIARWTAFVVAVTALLHWIDPDVDRWPLVLAAIVAGNACSGYAIARRVHRYEREHDVEIFLDGGREDDEDERLAGDPGRMFRRARR